MGCSEINAYAADRRRGTKRLRRLQALRTPSRGSPNMCNSPPPPVPPPRSSNPQTAGPRVGFDCERCCLPAGPAHPFHPEVRRAAHALASLLQRPHTLPTSVSQSSPLPHSHPRSRAQLAPCAPLLFPLPAILTHATHRNCVCFVAAAAAERRQRHSPPSCSRARPTLLVCPSAVSGVSLSIPLLLPPFLPWPLGPPP